MTNDADLPPPQRSEGSTDASATTILPADVLVKLKVDVATMASIYDAIANEQEAKKQHGAAALSRWTAARYRA